MLAIFAAQLVVQVATLLAVLYLDRKAHDEPPRGCPLRAQDAPEGGWYAPNPPNGGGDPSAVGR